MYIMIDKNCDTMHAMHIQRRCTRLIIAVSLRALMHLIWMEKLSVTRSRDALINAILL